MRCRSLVAELATIIGKLADETTFGNRPRYNRCIMRMVALQHMLEREFEALVAEAESRRAAVLREDG